jgi:hypothetical protein
VRGAALYSLAQTAKDEDVAAQLYERLVTEYGDVLWHEGLPDEAKLGEMARDALFEIRTLGLGKPAPEIAGADLTGIPFKLSDYRGKVVLLDFWGYW